ncbi:MAG: xanthine dehydrogenase subunit XdhB [Negativicutes bacterium]|jgi:xanthine dehydrogenase FAD-binding subunit
MYDIAAYHEPASIAEAVKTLNDNPRAIIIAGGSDVLIRIRDGKKPNAELVSIRNISELRGVTISADGNIVIGPATPFSKIAANADILKYIPIVAEGVSQVGGPQVRNIGTIGGNVSNGATSADSAPSLFALNAKLKLQGPEGVRVVNIADFYKGPGKVDFKPAEMLTQIIIEKNDYENYGGQYIKYSMRKAMDIATLGVCAWCKVDGKRIVDLRIALGVAAPTPMRCTKAEAEAVGKEFSAELVANVAGIALKEARPRTSWRASREFRLQLVYELVTRAVNEAYKRAGGIM